MVTGVEFNGLGERGEETAAGVWRQIHDCVVLCRIRCVSLTTEIVTRGPFFLMSFQVVGIDRAPAVYRISAAAKDVRRTGKKKV